MANSYFQKKKKKKKHYMEKPSWMVDEYATVCQITTHLKDCTAAPCIAYFLYYKLHYIESHDTSRDMMPSTITIWRASYWASAYSEC